MAYPHDHENDIIYFGKVNFRNKLQTFGIKTDDRRRHMYVIGKTGMGKTTLIENLFLSDVYAGHGCCYIDPHGDAAEKLIDHIPSWRVNDVVYFNPADLEYPMGFNILENVDPEMKHLIASGLMGVFKKIWEGVWSARMEYIMNNTILALLDTPGTTLLGINRMLSDEEYRTNIIKNITDPIVKQFWIQEFGNYQDKFASEAVAPIQNKVGQFISASVIRNIVAQAKSTLRIREIMDDQKIFIVNLSKGRVGEDASRLLGGMLITKIQMSAMERVDTEESERNDFYLYVDEFQNFAVESFASILSEARKYRLNLVMAHQYIAQLTEEVRDAVFGNVGTIVTFRVGSPDAQFMEDEFTPRFTPEDLINLPKFNIYLKLMIDGVTSQPFSAVTLPPIAHKTDSIDKVIAQSRENYAIPKEQIESLVKKWSGFDEDTDVEEEMAEVKKKKKEAKKEKYMHTYNCDVCGKEIKLPVELDRSKPIYCDDHHPKKVAEDKKAKRQERNNSSNKNSSDRDRKEKRVVDEVPRPKDGELIEKEAPKEELSLSALKKDSNPEPQSPDPSFLRRQGPSDSSIESEKLKREEPKREESKREEKLPEPEEPQGKPAPSVEENSDLSSAFSPGPVHRSLGVGGKSHSSDKKPEEKPEASGLSAEALAQAEEIPKSDASSSEEKSEVNSEPEDENLTSSFQPNLSVRQAGEASGEISKPDIKLSEQKTAPRKNDNHPNRSENGSNSSDQSSDDGGKKRRRRRRKRNRKSDLPVISTEPAQPAGGRSRESNSHSSSFLRRQGSSAPGDRSAQESGKLGEAHNNNRHSGSGPVDSSFLRRQEPVHRSLDAGGSSAQDDQSTQKPGKSGELKPGDSSGSSFLRRQESSDQIDQHSSKNKSVISTEPKVSGLSMAALAQVEEISKSAQGSNKSGELKPGDIINFD